LGIQYLALGYAGSIREVSVVMAAFAAGSLGEKFGACVWQAQCHLAGLW